MNAIDAFARPFPTRRNRSGRESRLFLDIHRRLRLRPADEAGACDAGQSQHPATRISGDRRCPKADYADTSGGKHENLFHVGLHLRRLRTPPKASRGPWIQTNMNCCGASRKAFAAHSLRGGTGAHKCGEASRGFGRFPRASRPSPPRPAPPATVCEPNSKGAHAYY